MDDPIDWTRFTALQTFETGIHIQPEYPFDVDSNITHPFFWLMKTLKMLTSSNQGIETIVLHVSYVLRGRKTVSLDEWPELITFLLDRKQFPRLKRVHVRAIILGDSDSGEMVGCLEQYVAKLRSALGLQAVLSIIESVCSN